MTHIQGFSTALTQLLSCCLHCQCRCLLFYVNYSMNTFINNTAYMKLAAWILFVTWYFGSIIWLQGIWSTIFFLAYFLKINVIGVLRICFQPQRVAPAEGQEDASGGEAEGRKDKDVGVPDLVRILD